jgi:hypothetical protein
MTDLQRVRAGLALLGYSEAAGTGAGAGSALVVTTIGTVEDGDEGQVVEAIEAGRWRRDTGVRSRLAFDEDGALIPDACTFNEPVGQAR